MAEKKKGNKKDWSDKKEEDEDEDEEDDEDDEEHDEDSSEDEENEQNEALMMRYYRQGLRHEQHVDNSLGGGVGCAVVVVKEDDDGEVLIKDIIQTPNNELQSQNNSNNNNKKKKKKNKIKQKKKKMKDKNKATRQQIVEQNRNERKKVLEADELVKVSEDEEEDSSIDPTSAALAAAAEAAAQAAASALTTTSTKVAENKEKLLKALDEFKKCVISDENNGDADEKYTEALKNVLNFAKRYPRIRLANQLLPEHAANLLRDMGFVEERGYLVKTLPQKAFIHSNIEELELLLTQLEMKDTKMYIDFSKITTIKHNSNVNIESIKRFKVGHADTIGRRPTMEDEIMILGSYRGKDELIGVFDGHGGRNAAVVASQILPVILEELLEKEFADDPKQGLREAFLRTHQQICKAKLQSGTTALVVLLTGNRMFIAHAGDSRGVLCRKGRAIRLTQDHKPNHPDEKKRIKKLGGKVVSGWGWFTKVYRVNGILSVARALGDEDLQPFVSWEPTIQEIDISSHDRFLILGCDGVWDKVSDKKAVSIVSKCKDPTKASEMLRDYAFKHGSTDNITVVVLYF
eukprot:TRINITY_DN3146_c0_g9_i1.p1 TRINITY_DN3146_c0_g9~~TRINITY_DN3146_c0_g9_i1.p1  ORF type:complete len:575 (-),score=160.32 TRINITY_DN3146_c0_g9_i1:92-1816(-)